MKKTLLAIGLAVAALSASAQVSVNIGGRIAPGVYGSVNLGDLGGERPTFYNDTPTVLYPDAADNVYLYVPEWQQRDWRRYCWKYQACHRRVYFVQENWVRDYHSHWEERQRFEERREHMDRFEEHRDHHEDRHWENRGPRPEERGQEHHDDHGHDDHGGHEHH